MGLPKEFEEDEVREGFYVNGMVKKIWAAQVDALDFLNEYCKKHGLRWFMAYGSLLGIVRHHGFIPWDDDCDIWMLRNDFNCLLKLLNSEKSCNFQILESRMSDYDCYTPILTNSKVRISFDKDELRRNRDQPYTTTIDLFVLDYVSRNEEDEEWRDVAVKAAVNVNLSLNALDKKPDSSENTGVHASSADLSFEGVNSKARNISIDELEQGKMENAAYNATLKELENLVLLTDHKFSKTEPLLPQINLVYTGLVSYFKEEESDLVRAYPNDLYNGFSGWDKHFFDEVVEMPFEGRFYPVPAAYDKILQGIYGDYNKRIIGTAVHQYPFFDKFEREMLQYNELEFNPYHFTCKKEEMPTPDKRLPSPKQTVREYLSILARLQDMIDNRLAEMDASDIEEVSQNLQKLAVAIGNQIESSRGTKHVCIPTIEAYCEQVYQCFVLLTKGELTLENLKCQKNLFDIMRNQIQTEYLDRREVLFLLDRRKNWKAIESLWKVFSEDPAADVSVLMMPFFYKNADSSLKEDKKMDPPSGIPDEVQMVTEESYPIASRHPDLIITVNGYDYFNYIRSVPLSLYTKVLWKYTDQLIYIPWFKIDAFTENDPQWVTVKYFAQIPGVFYADRTVVQSEPVRCLYIKAAEEMEKDIPESYWEEKIASWGSPLDDSEKKTKVAENIYQHLVQNVD
ncbi:phosphorylcholine transferase LicD [Lachnospiraceae bacterium YH-ros2228]